MGSGINISPRAKMIISTSFVVLSVVGAIIGLTIGLQEQPPPCGGSPECDEVASSKAASQRQYMRARERRSSKLYPPLPEYYHQISENIGRISKNSVNSESTSAGTSAYRSYPTAAVATDTNICSEISANILRAGNGSAVDAAIVAELCVGIVNAQSCGLGGGHFALIYEKPRGKSQKVLMALVSRERAPAAATQDMFINTTDASVKGGLAIAVPGEIRGFYEAWKMFGRLPWKDLFQSAIQLCEEGFYVEAALAAAIEEKEADIRADPNLSELFVKENGSLVQEGDLLVNPKLGATMRAIADDPFTFYNGTLAVDIVRDIQDYGGIITLDDLRNYKSSMKTPLNVTLQNGDFTVFNPPPPSSGAILDYILNILDGYSLNETSISGDYNKTLTYHRIIESFKFAYAKRSMLGDEDYVDIEELLYNLTSDEYAESIRLQIDDVYTHDIEYYGPSFDNAQDHGTINLDVLAPDGAAVALSATINLFFGSKCRGSRTGIIFNDEMDDFSTPGTVNDFGVPASPSNYIVPGKMPMSSMNPSLFVDKQNSIVFMSGGAGGTKITTQTAFVSLNALWFKLNLGNATDTPRIHHQLSPNEVVYEDWLEQAIVDGLIAKNHTLVPTTGNAVVNSIDDTCSQVPTVRGNKYLADCIGAVIDFRRGGVPDGF